MKQIPLPSAQPPSRFATLLEARVPFEILGGVIDLPKLALAPKGDGRSIMLLPGYMTDEKSMWPMGAFLRSLGYEVFDWGLGKNRGNVDPDIHRIGDRLSELSEDAPEPMTLIGWSLGGVIAREAARLYESRVREVITLGTPILGGPKYTAVAGRYAKSKSLNLDVFEKEVHERNSIGIKQPVTSIYSESDGVVGWQASIDVYNPQANNVKVTSSHLGLGLRPKIWALIADILSKS